MIHPIVGELRAQRLAKNQLWRQLRLPDEQGHPTGRHSFDSETARAAAMARWGRTPGASAIRE